MLIGSSGTQDRCELPSMGNCIGLPPIHKLPQKNVMHNNHRYWIAPDLPRITWQKRHPSLPNVPFTWRVPFLWKHQDHQTWSDRFSRWNWSVEADVPWSALCGGPDPFKVKVVGWFNGKWIQDYTFSKTNIQLAPVKWCLCSRYPPWNWQLEPENWWLWDKIHVLLIRVYFQWRAGGIFMESGTFPLQLNFPLPWFNTRGSP